jgi:hypothetical protein
VVGPDQLSEIAVRAFDPAAGYAVGGISLSTIDACKNEPSFRRHRRDQLVGHWSSDGQKPAGTHRDLQRLPRPEGVSEVEGVPSLAG